MYGRLRERRAGGREFQIVGHATEKLRAPNAVPPNGTVSTLVLDDLRERNEQECESTGEKCKYALCKLHCADLVT